MKLPEIGRDLTIPEAEKMTQGAHMAFGGHPADNFMEDVFRLAKQKRERRAAKAAKFGPKTSVSY